MFFNMRETTQSSADYGGISDRSISKYNAKSMSKLRIRTLGSTADHQHSSGVFERKQNLILNWAQTNNYRTMESSPFIFTPHDVNIADERKNTPLYYAAYNGNVKMCQFLCEKGANVNVVCSKGDTPLHMAFKSGSPEVRYFIDIFFLNYIDCVVHLQQRW
jgi:Ankyrin repeats (3 copies)